MNPVFRVFWNLTGGTTGCLDNYRSDGVGSRSQNPLQTGDIALVVSSADGPVGLKYNAASVETPDGKSVVIPVDLTVSDPGRWLRDDYDGEAIDYTDAEIIGAKSVAIGSPNSEVGREVPAQEVQIENEAGDKLLAYARTVELSDNTEGFEDVIVRERTLVGGTFGMSFSSKIYTSAPSGSETPVYGCRVQADRATWDPASKGSGGSYWVWYNGSSWVAIDAQAS